MYNFYHIDPPDYRNAIPDQTYTVLEGLGFTYFFGFEAKPNLTSFTWSRDYHVYFHPLAMKL